MARIQITPTKKTRPKYTNFISPHHQLPSENRHSRITLQLETYLPGSGNHLGGALVGLLNSINEFRTKGEDHVETIMEYIDEQGYQDMINQPDHALAILFFAEEFQFKDLWISAFVHCCGMNEKLAFCDGFEVGSCLLLLVPSRHVN